MKKYLMLSLLIIFVFAFNLKSQDNLSVTISSKNYSAGTIEVPVKLEFIDPTLQVGAFDLRIEIDDPSVLNVLSANPGPGLPAGMISPVAGSNPFVVSWASTSGLVSTSLTDDLLLTLVMDASAGTSSLTFVFGGPIETQFYENDAQSSPIQTKFNNGMIAITSAVPLPVWVLFLSAGLFAVYITFKRKR